MIIGYESVHQASLSGLGRGYFGDFRRGRGRGVCSLPFSLEFCPFPLETRDTQATVEKSEIFGMAVSFLSYPGCQRLFMPTRQSSPAHARK